MVRICICIFAEALANGDSQRPDILLKSPRAFAGQSDAPTRQVATEGLSSGEADFEDLRRNADLYIFNQDDRQD